MKERYILKYKRSRGRRRSTIHVNDSYSKATEILHMEEVIGNGGYGTVRLFSNQGMKLAVKTNLFDESFATEEEAGKFKRDIKREYKLTKIAYPNDLYNLKIYEVSNIDASDEYQTLIDYRFVMPYVKGTDLFSIEFKAFSSENLIKLFIRIAQELFRLHKLGIVHGDVSARNIKYQPQNNAYEFKIRFLDFGLAHREYEYVNLACLDTLHLAPEISQEEPLLANANQDVYSLGELYDYILSETPVTRRALEDSYPSIRKFITTARDLQPDKRPKLEDFIYHLSLQILEISRENCDPKVKQLIRAIFTNNKTKITEIVTAADYELEKGIIKLAGLLITHHFYTEASLLLNTDSQLLQRHKHHTSQLIGASFADVHLPVFLFTQLLDLLSDKFIRNKFFSVEQGVITPIQHLARNNRRDLIALLFKHLSWHNVYSLSKEHIQSIDTLPSNSLKLLVDLAILNGKYEFRVEDEFVNGMLEGQLSLPSAKYFELSGDMLASLFDDETGPLFDAKTLQQIKSDEVLNAYFVRLKKCAKLDHKIPEVHHRTRHRL